MRGTTILNRSLGQLISPQPLSSTHIRRSCRTQASNLQRRQIQSSAYKRAGFVDRFRGKGAQEEDAASVPQKTRAQQKLEAKGWAESPDKDPNYIEATTWDGLERIGSENWVEDQLDPYDNYEGWTQLTKASKLETEEAERILLPVAQELMKNVTEAKGRAWLDTPITSLDAKFQIAKRLQQEAGIRISDYAMNSASTLRDIRRQLLVKHEPKKLAQKLREEEEIQELANVKVHARRVTPIDKEKAVGRWKVIEQQLIDRGLPVTGHSGRNKKIGADEV